MEEEEEYRYMECVRIIVSWGGLVRCRVKIDGRWDGPMTKEGQKHPFILGDRRRRGNTSRKRYYGGEE